MKRSDLKLWTLFYNKAGSLTLVYQENNSSVSVITSRGSTYDISNGKLYGNEHDIINVYKSAEDMSIADFISKIPKNQHNRQIINAIHKKYYTSSSLVEKLRPLQEIMNKTLYEIHTSLEEQEEILLIIK